MSFEESLAEDIVRTFSQRQKPSKGTVLNKIHHDFNEIEEYWTALEQGLTPARINALPFSTWVAISPLGYAHYFPKFMELTLLYPVEMRGNEYMRTFEISLDNIENNVDHSCLAACFREFTDEEMSVVRKWANWYLSSDFLQVVGYNYLQTKSVQRKAINLREMCGIKN